MIFPVKRLADLGFDLIATKGTADVLRRNGVHATVVRKHSEGAGPDGEPTHRRADLGRRGGDGRQHPVRASTPAPTATTSAPPRRAWTSRSSPPCSSSPRPCRASRRRCTGEVRVRSLQDHAKRPGPVRRHAREPARDRGGRERHAAACRVQVTGELIATRRVGAYQHLTFVAPGVAELARPGQFVALAVGGDTSATLLRRCFSIHKVSPSGTYGGTVDIVVAAHGPGTPWLTGLRAARRGRHRRPARASRSRCRPSRCLRAGRRRLRQRAAVLARRAAAARAGCHVEMVLGAASEDRLFGVVEARRAADGVTVTTDDGSAGTRGWVSDVLPRRHPAAPGRRRLRLRPDGACSRSITEVAAARGRGGAGRGRGVDGLRRRGLHDLRACR